MTSGQGVVVSTKTLVSVRRSPSSSNSADVAPAIIPWLMPGDLEQTEHVVVPASGYTGVHPPLWDEYRDADDYTVTGSFLDRERRPAGDIIDPRSLVDVDSL